MYEYMYGCTYKYMNFTELLTEVFIISPVDLYVIKV